MASKTLWLGKWGVAHDINEAAAKTMLALSIIPTTSWPPPRRPWRAASPPAPSTRDIELHPIK